MKKILLLSSMMIVCGLFATAQVVKSDLQGKLTKVNLAEQSALLNVNAADMQLQGITKSELYSAQKKNVADNPWAYYSRPEGTFYAGLDAALDAYFLGIVGPVLQPWKYKNQSTGASSVSWVVNNSAVQAESDGSYIASYPAEGLYYLPVLTATSGTSSATHQYGSYYEDAAAIAINETPVLLSNASWYTDSTTSHFDVYALFTGPTYIYGTGVTLPGTSVAGFYSAYDKPLTPLTIDSVFVPMASISGTPIPATDTLFLYLVSSNAVVGYSYVTASDLSLITSGTSSTIYSAGFGFKSVDELGFETAAPIVVSDTFEIYLFTTAGMDFGLYVDTYNDDNKTAYMLGGDDHYYSYPNWNVNFHISLNGVFATGTSAVNNVKTDQLSKVVRAGNDYKISYPAAFTALKMFNITGQLVAEYQLPNTGEAILPASNLPNGTYLLRFEGSASETVKIVR